MGWARALEAVYMEEENLAYISDKDDMENKKEFIEVYMTEQYNDIKRGIKCHCSNTHGTAVWLREAPLPKKIKKCHQQKRWKTYQKVTSQWHQPQQGMLRMVT